MNLTHSTVVWLTKRLLQLALTAGLFNLPLITHAQMLDNTPTAQVMVKFRSDSDLSVKAIAQKNTKANLKQFAEILGQTRADLLQKTTGLKLQAQAHVSEHMQIISAQGISAADLARRLGGLKQVEYAVPSRRKYVRAVPNDPRFNTQWWLQNAQPSAINAVGAWDISTGSASVIVAVIDTGIRLDHEDLQGKLVPGYDFVSDIPTANDGDGRDADPSDPGDWIESSDLTQTVFSGCVLENSSWHGTRVGGIIGAASNNGVGVAGVGWGVRILPVRVLGKCGGTDADILAGMRWAAGLNVPGVPANPNPARILNLSLGSSDPCSAPYRDVIAELKSIGVMVVASAGNDVGKAVGEPANCPGAVAVAAVRHIGTKVGFSSLGPEVSISAPGGNCGTGTECLYPINTTVNAGVKGPTTNTYTDGFNPTVGTSFSAPIVAGVAALMWSINPSQTVDEVLLRMRSTAKPFPVSSDTTVQNCVAPTTATQGECNCTTTTCGAGMMNALAALQAVPVPTPPATPTPVQTITPPTASSSGGGGGAIEWAALLGIGLLAMMGLRRKAQAAK